MFSKTPSPNLYLVHRTNYNNLDTVCAAETKIQIEEHAAV
jgi:hypothetical protein